MYKIYFQHGNDEKLLNVDESCLNTAILKNLEEEYNIVPQNNQHLYFEHPLLGSQQVDLNQRLSELLKGLKENRFVFRFENDDETFSEECQQSKRNSQSKNELKNQKDNRKTQAIYQNQYLINSVQQEYQQGSLFNIKIKEFLENYYHTQVAILFDSTHSMKVYQDFSLKLINSLFDDNQLIYEQKTKYAAVCYYDKLEEKINYNSYPFIQFTQEKMKIVEFLSKVDFFGGGDEAEDVKGGIEELCNNLEWNSILKIAVLICDSPSHGKLWAGNVLDFHQFVDLKPALQQLINKNIILVGIQFNDKTKQMYQQMKIFYENQGKSDYLLIIDLQSQKQIFVNINDHLQAFLTKQQNQITQQSVINKIDQQIINNFLMNCQNQQISYGQIIEEITLNGDSFISLNQYQQNDIITKKCGKIFKIDSNFGLFEDQKTYLAQSINQQNQNMNQLFTINSKPYKTIDDVIITQQIYFITKNLFNSFKFTLQQKIQNYQLPDLELQEKYFYKKSEFQIYQLDQFFNNKQYKLYNHNRGYMLDEESEINYILQSFSFYTLYKSQSRFILLNIQTIDNYICTPTLNTFDQQQSLENGGQQAIYQFINNLMKIKNKCNEYLKQFGIELES